MTWASACGAVLLGVVTATRGWKWWQAGLLAVAIGLICGGWRP